MDVSSTELLSGTDRRSQRCPMEDRPRVLLADDHALMLQRVKAILAPEFDVVGAVDNGLALVAAAERLNPDVLVVDISMPEMNGIEAVRQIKKFDGKARVVFLTVNGDPDSVVKCREVGALGYVVKAHLASELIPAIRMVLAGQTFVSPNVPWDN
jgi:DNA-binding NarL/FixJ family response regulator